MIREYVSCVATLAAEALYALLWLRCWKVT